MKFLIPFLLIGLTALLGGCNTLGTLASQFGETPLPPRVAAKLYGLCRECHERGVVPGCEKCVVVQQKRRMLAGTPASQITPELEAFVRSEDPGRSRESSPPRRKSTSVYSRPMPPTNPAPLSKPTPTPAFSHRDNPPPQPRITPRSQRKPDGYDTLGYGDKPYGANQ